MAENYHPLIGTGRKEKKTNQPNTSTKYREVRNEIGSGLLSDPYFPLIDSAPFNPK